MELTKEEERILNGKEGYAKQKSMEILVALGNIFGADKLIKVKSVQVAGVSYHNLGDAGLEFLEDTARDGRVSVRTTLNPAGMDLENWRSLGISEDFAAKQNKVIDAYAKMGIEITCTCTPYFVGNKPSFGEHVAWSESSAVTFANSVLGARSNREGGPSALAAAITGRTANYGLHLDENRIPEIVVNVETELQSLPEFGALGYVIGKKAENQIPYITGIKKASVDQLKSLSASIVTYGAKPLFHIEKLTPESLNYEKPEEDIVVKRSDIEDALRFLQDEGSDIDFVCVGCPHCSIEEIREVAELLKGKKVSDKVEFWVATARQIKNLADEKGYTKTIENAGAKFACDTCMVVAPLKGRFNTVGTTSAKACYYCRGHNNMRTRIGSIKQCVDAAIKGKWN